MDQPPVGTKRKLSRKNHGTLITTSQALPASAETYTTPTHNPHMSGITLQTKQLSYRALLSTSLLLTAMITLTGCDASEYQSAQKKQRDQAEQALKQATVHMNNAASGGFHEKLAPDADFDIAQYRLEQLSKATQLLNDAPPVPAMEYAAASLGSNIASTEARHGLNNTLEAWTLQTARATRLIGLVSAINSANIIATEQAKVDSTQAIAAIRQTEKELIARNDGLQADSKKQQDLADALQKSIDQNNKGHRDNMAEADKLSREAYTAKGQMQYDLYIRASTAKQVANNFSSKVSLDEAKISIHTAQLKLNSTILAGIKEQIAQSRQSIEVITQRAQQRAEQVRKATEAGKQNASDFDTVFKQFAQLQLDGITAPLQDVNAKFAQAVQQGQNAMQNAPGSAGALAAIHYNATRTEFGNALGQQALIHSAYAQTLQTLADALGAALPNRVSQINDAITDANKAADDARAAAKTHLEESDKEFETLAQGGSATQRSIVLRNRIAAQHALARVTDDSSYLDRAKTFQQQLANPDQ